MVKNYVVEIKSFRGGGGGNGDSSSPTLKDVGKRNKGNKTNVKQR